MVASKALWTTYSISKNEASIFVVRAEGTFSSYRRRWLCSQLGNVNNRGRSYLKLHVVSHNDGRGFESWHRCQGPFLLSTLLYSDKKVRSQEE
jgi:hypothetical protein